MSTQIHLSFQFISNHHVQYTRKCPLIDAITYTGSYWLAHNSPYIDLSFDKHKHLRH